MRQSVNHVHAFQKAAGDIMLQTIQLPHVEWSPCQTCTHLEVMDTPEPVRQVCRCWLLGPIGRFHYKKKADY